MQTETAIAACDIGIWIDDDGGALTDVSGSSNRANLNFDREIGMFRTFQSRWPRRLECGKDARLTLGIIYSTAADEGFDILKKWYFAADPGDRTVKLYVPDKNVGSDVFSGEWKLQSFNFPLNAGSGEPVEVTAELVPNGEVSHATNAT